MEVASFLMKIVIILMVKSWHFRVCKSTSTSSLNWFIDLANVQNLYSVLPAIHRDPDFRNIKMGSRVLAKQKNNMWHRSVVLKLPEKEEGEYRVKFEASGKIIEARLQDLLPLGKCVLKIT